MNSRVLTVIFCLFFVCHYSIAQDFANTLKYKELNSRKHLPAIGENRVVFIGNSIIEAWKDNSTFFSDTTFLNRGISAQTSVHILVRFRTDVINLKPKVVVILVGTNDIAENLGPCTEEMIANNIISMAELAKAHNIKVVLCSVLPTLKYSWNPGIEPAEKILTLNKLIKKYALANNCVYLDYYSAMVDSNKAAKEGLTFDGLHPNAAGYKIMEPLTREAIKKALMSKKKVIQKVSK